MVLILALATAAPAGAQTFTGPASDDIWKPWPNSVPVYGPAGRILGRGFRFARRRLFALRPLGRRAGDALRDPNGDYSTYDMSGNYRRTTPRAIVTTRGFSPRAAATTAGRALPRSPFFAFASARVGTVAGSSLPSASSCAEAPDPGGRVRRAHAPGVDGLRRPVDGLWGRQHRAEGRGAGRWGTCPPRWRA
jgi:hypothetical protein